jgi:hypothetical protein
MTTNSPINQPSLAERTTSQLLKVKKYKRLSMSSFVVRCVFSLFYSVLFVYVLVYMALWHHSNRRFICNMVSRTWYHGHNHRRRQPPGAACLLQPPNPHYRHSAIRHLGKGNLLLPYMYNPCCTTTFTSASNAAKKESRVSQSLVSDSQQGDGEREGRYRKRRTFCPCRRPV